MDRPTSAREGIVNICIHASPATRLHTGALGGSVASHYISEGSERGEARETKWTPVVRDDHGDRRIPLLHL